MEGRDSSRKACIFCGAFNQKMSKEHVWPEWVRNALPAEQLHGGHTYIFENSEGEMRDRRRIGQPPFDLKVRDVCEPCNNQWMNRAEEAGMPYLLAMAEDKGRELHKLAQAKISFWAVLKCLMAQRVFRSDPHSELLDPQDYRDLYALRDSHSLPNYFTVYAGRTAWSEQRAPNGFFRMSGLSRGPIDEGDRYEGYALTFSVLNLVVVVLRLGEGDERAEFHQLPGSPSVTGAIRRVWPVGRPIIWPPGAAITGSGLDALAGGAP